MSVTSLSNQLNQCAGSVKPIRIVELLLDYCGQLNGQGDCQAKTLCRNTWSTCNYTCAYTCTKKSWWLSSCQLPAEYGIDAIPVVKSVDATPTEVALGKAFSSRGSVNINLTQIDHNDFGVDPYLARRYGRIPICEDVPGGFLQRFAETNKFMRGRMIRIYDGFEGGNFPADFTCREYIIKKRKWISSCELQVQAKDILSLASNKSAQCPRIGRVTDSTGTDQDLALNGDLAETRFIDGRVILTLSPTQTELDLLNSEYLCVGEELLKIRWVTGTDQAGNQAVFAVIEERGACGTEISAHEDGAAMIVPFLVPADTHFADVITRLLTECARLEEIVAGCCDEESVSRIDQSSFDAYKRCNPSLKTCEDVIICEPTGLTTLLNEFAPFMLDIYVDPRDGMIKLNEMRPADKADMQTIPECAILSDVTPEDLPDEQLSQLAFVYDPKVKTASPTRDNMLRVRPYATADSLRAVCDRREYPDTNYDEIVSRWICPENRWIVQVYATRWLRLNRCDPRLLPLKLDARYVDNIGPTDQVIIQSQYLVDENGEPSTEVWRVRSAELDDRGLCYDVKLISTGIDCEDEHVDKICDLNLCAESANEDECDPVECRQLW